MLHPPILIYPGCLDSHEGHSLYIRVNMPQDKILDTLKKSADNIQIVVKTQPGETLCQITSSSSPSLFGLAHSHSPSYLNLSETKTPERKGLKEKQVPYISFDLLPDAHSPDKTPIYEPKPRADTDF